MKQGDDIGVVAPWLVIASPGQAVIRVDLRQLDCVTPIDDQGAHLLLSCCDLEVALWVAEGSAAATRLASEALPWTRADDGASKPIPTIDIRNHIADRGRLVVISATADGEIRSDDGLAGSVYELGPSALLVGRTGDSDIIIDHPSISREHARVTCTSSENSGVRYCIADLHASNGVRINGARCIARELNNRDIVDLGHVRMRYLAPSVDVGDWHTPSSPDLESFLVVGDDAVILAGDRIQVGSVSFSVQEVEEYSARGVNLALAPGRLLQAALAMLVVAAHERQHHTLEARSGVTTM